MADAQPRIADIESLNGPRGLRLLDRAGRDDLAARIRARLVDRVSRTGGHLGPNLGVVELTLAIHRVFDSPVDRILFDTGHQAYVHKMVTGRAAAFDALRRSGGLSGYPSAAESEHDVIENSHASTALSYADGLTKAYVLTGRTDRHVVAVVGDGALTGGMAWEALNNIAAAKAPNLVIVVNDNGRSYAPTVGGLAERLGALRTAPQYERVLHAGEQALRGIPLVGELAYRAAHGAKSGFRDFTSPQMLFGDLGLKYLGPVDGHDVEALEQALRRAKGFAEPVIVHCVTRKGAGYGPAENDPADCFHGIGVIDPKTGRPHSKAGAPTWTSVFADELVRIGGERPDVVAITAAMLRPVGLERFAAAFPGRVFNVGIAEQHAVTSAVGLAMGGLHPVVAVYATFLNRAFDQVLMDAALHRRGVTLVLDRAGVTGEDGPSHNGMWDTAMLQVVPGLRLAAPRDPGSLRVRLREAVGVSDAPTVVRFPKASAGSDIPALERLGGVEVLARGEREDVLLVSVGALAQTCLRAAERLAEAGLGVTVADPCWAKPLDAALVELAQRHRLVVTVEDGVRTGGVGAALAQLLRDAEVFIPQHEFGIPARFLEQGTRQEVLDGLGLSAVELAAEIGALHARVVKNGGEVPAGARPSSE